MLVHWLNHRQKLAIKDAFRGTFFGEIDVILIKNYHLYKNDPKRLCELKESRTIFSKIEQNPWKSTHTKLRQWKLIISKSSIFGPWPNLTF